jgi:hypothetical protein
MGSDQALAEQAALALEAEQAALDLEADQALALEAGLMGWGLEGAQSRKTGTGGARNR